MSSRSRIVAFGSAAGLVLAGIVCAVAVSGVTGEVLTVVLISLGLGGALLLVFFEIGLSDEREIAREERGRQQRARSSLQMRRHSRLRRWPRRPG